MHFMGPRLVDYVLALLEERGYNSQQVAEEFGVGLSWYSDIKYGRVKQPRADTIQLMYEKLTGRPLVNGDPGGRNEQGAPPGSRASNT